MPSALGMQQLEPVEGHAWQAALQGLRADALDCLQTTPALVADRAHGHGAHLALGARLSFPQRRDGDVLAVPSALAERLAQAGDLLGLRVAPPQGPLDAGGVRGRLAESGTLYVVADAYDLPWMPYAGHRHMAHGFLLEAGPYGCTVVDAYHNDTEWGHARPGAWRLEPDRLDVVLRAGALVTRVEARAAPPHLGLEAVLAGNAARAEAAGREIEGYAAAVRAALSQREVAERLVLDVWLLGRDRALHAAWLAARDRAGDARIVEEQAEAWRRLAAQSYLALRRSGRGGAFNPAVVDDVTRLLHADAEVAGALGDRARRGTGQASSDEVAGAVAAALHHVLETDGATALEGPLRDLPGFDSFRLVEIVEHVERRLGVRLPVQVAAEDLRDVEGLRRLFARTVEAAAAPAGRRG